MSTTASPSASISPAKLRANRRNAKKSTGPRTPRGKSRACQNALTHGLCAAKDILLPKESPEEFEQLREILMEDLNPTDSIELAIFQRLLSARWKLRRVPEAESRQTKLETMREECLRRSYKETEFAAELWAAHLEDWDKLGRHEQRLENAFYKALRELEAWRREKRAALKAQQTEDVEGDEDIAAEAP